jgi:hypothetical protein
MQFPIQRYTFTWQADTNILFPAFSGSLLRGQFGNQLRKLVCFTKQTTCVKCPLIERCSYGKLYETVASGDDKHTKQEHPYIIEPIEYPHNKINLGEQFSFSMVLLGDSYKDLALYIYVWEKIFNDGIRLHNHRATAKILKITTATETVYDATLDAPLLAISQPEITLTATTNKINTIQIKLLTPLRLQGRNEQGQSIIIGPRNFNAKAFIQALDRRTHNYLTKYNLARLDQNINNYVLENLQLTWVKTTRYSSSQQQEMDLFGIVGEFDIIGTNLEDLVLALRLSEFLHLGKSTTFGFGKLSIEVN